MTTTGHHVHSTWRRNAGRMRDIEEYSGFREKSIRLVAYLKWEKSGCPEGMSDHFWYAAVREFEAKDAEQIKKARQIVVLSGGEHF